MRRALTGLLFIAGIGNALPVTGVLGADQLAALYGVSAVESDVLLLLQHRAVLFGLLGGFLMVAAFRPALHGAALIAALVSMLSFVALSWLTGPHHPLIARVVVVDIVLSVLLLPAAAVHFIAKRQEYRTETIA